MMAHPRPEEVTRWACRAGISTRPTAWQDHPQRPPTLRHTWPPSPIRSRTRDPSSPRATGCLARCYSKSL